MKALSTFILLSAIIASASYSQVAVSESEHCKTQHIAADIEAADTLQSLSALRKANTVLPILDFLLSYRTFEIEKSAVNAAALLKRIPQTEQQEIIRYTISGHDCFGLTEKETNALDSEYDGLSPLLQKAIMLAPQFMDRYVSYSLLATMDVHSDYTDRMVPVCRKYHAQFLRSVSLLPPESRQWMRKHLFDPERCKSLNPQEE
jgi:hypothetical protein